MDKASRNFRPLLLIVPNDSNAIGIKSISLDGIQLFLVYFLIFDNSAVLAAIPINEALLPDMSLLAMAPPQ